MTHVDGIHSLLDFHLQGQQSARATGVLKMSVT